MPKLNSLFPDDAIPAQRLTVESKSAFAARVGLTKGRISQLISDGLPVTAKGKIEIAAALEWLDRNLDPDRRQKTDTAKGECSSPSLTEARRLHIIVQAQRGKLALEQERGQLINRAEAIATVFARGRAERDAHIAWVQRSAPVIAAELEADAGKCFAVLDRLMREHLDWLAKLPLGELQDAGRD